MPNTPNLHFPLVADKRFSGITHRCGFDEGALPVVSCETGWRQSCFLSAPRTMAALESRSNIADFHHHIEDIVHRLRGGVVERSSSLNRHLTGSCPCSFGVFRDVQGDTAGQNYFSVNGAKHHAEEEVLPTQPTASDGFPASFCGYSGTSLNAWGEFGMISPTTWSKVDGRQYGNKTNFERDHHPPQRRSYARTK